MARKLYRIYGRISHCCNKGKQNTLLSHHLYWTEHIKNSSHFLRHIWSLNVMRVLFSIATKTHYTKRDVEFGVIYNPWFHQSRWCGNEPGESVLPSAFQRPEIRTLTYLATHAGNQFITVDKLSEQGCIANVHLEVTSKPWRSISRKTNHTKVYIANAK